MTANSSEVDDEVANRYERIVSADRVRVEAYIRSLAPAPGPKQQQESVLDRLNRLEQEGTVDETTVSVWGTAICLEGPYRETAACRRIESRIGRFRQWAASVDETVELPFETQAISSSIVGDEYERLVPPQVCLAIHTNEGLELVLPCAISETPVSVVDTLDRLAAVDSPTAESASQSTSST
jgi:hypothetical protein